MSAFIIDVIDSDDEDVSIFHPTTCTEGETIDLCSSEDDEVTPRSDASRRQPNDSDQRAPTRPIGKKESRSPDEHRLRSTKKKKKKNEDRSVAVSSADHAFVPVRPSFPTTLLGFASPRGFMTVGNTAKRLSSEKKRRDGISKSGDVKYDVKISDGSEAPLCKHGFACGVFMVKKEGPNKGRRFYNCAQKGEGRCESFEWILDQAADDDESQSAASVAIPEGRSPPTPCLASGPPSVTQLFRVHVQGRELRPRRGTVEGRPSTAGSPAEAKPRRRQHRGSAREATTTTAPPATPTCPSIRRFSGMACLSWPTKELDRRHIIDRQIVRPVLGASQAGIWILFGIPNFLRLL